MNEFTQEQFNKMVPGARLVLLVMAAEWLAVQRELDNMDYYAKDEYSLAMKAAGVEDGGLLDDETVRTIDHEMDRMYAGLEKRQKAIADGANAAFGCGDDGHGWLLYILAHWSEWYEEEYLRLVEGADPRVALRGKEDFREAGDEQQS